MLSKKNSDGHGYKYSDIAEITKLLEENGYDYYQEVKSEDGEDYIYTTPIKDGKELTPRRGCRIVKATLPQGKANPVQEYGSALTYARRYSLMMAFGIAPIDDDGETFTGAKEEPKKKPEKKTEKMATQLQIVSVRSLAGETEYPEEKWCAKYNKAKYEQLTQDEVVDLGKRVESALKAKKVQ